MDEGVENGVEDPVVWNRELAALLAFVSAAGSVALLAFVPIVALVLALDALVMGGWAAARGEHAVVATVAILLALTSGIAAALLLLT